MDLWKKARSFAEDAAKRSQELTKEAVKRSSELTAGSSSLSTIVSEASKRADQIKAEAAKRVDKIKSLAENITPNGALVFKETTETPEQQEEDLERFGVTEELREFVREITLSTFQDFPMADDSEMSNVPTVSNVRKDLNEWQEKHAYLVLSTVKEISKLRYELCPRIMKERKFWRIYFLLVHNHVAPYEKRYMENMTPGSSELIKDDEVKKTAKVETNPKSEAKEPNQQNKTSKPASTEQDLDVFLLGGESDEGPDDPVGEFDDDLDQLVDSSGDEKEKS